MASQDHKHHRPHGHGHPSNLIVPLDDALITQSQATVAQALKDRNINLRFETKESAKTLQHLCAASLKGLEALAFDMCHSLPFKSSISFIEDDDPDMRLLSLRDASTQDTVGFIFWRNITGDEMKKWLKDVREIDSDDSSDESSIEALGEDLSKLSLNEKSQKSHHHHVALSKSSSSIFSSSSERSLLSSDPDAIPDIDGWIKIELVCINPKYQNQHLGSLLLAAALAFAVVKEHKSHAVLQLAGGEENKPALALYQKFQFEPASEYFGTPNHNLYVLWNIRKAFKELKFDGYLLRRVSKPPLLSAAGGATSSPKLALPGPKS